jgi:hypothetical protein
MRRPSRIHLPLTAALLLLTSGCGDDALRPPPTIDGVWEGEVVLHGELHSIGIELETTHHVEKDGFFGPSAVAVLRGRATVQFGDSITAYGVTGSHDLGAALDVGTRYSIYGFYTGGSVINGNIYDRQPPDHDLADRGQVFLDLERVTGR